MIWFSCKQCGKVHGRSESSIGTTIFCDCGQGLIVPWESTASEPEKAPEAAAPPAASSVPAVPRLKPIVFDSSGPPPLPPRGPSSAPPGPRRERERERERRGPRDPNSCLNHDNRIKQNTCADCGEGFCSLCLVTFRGKMLCAACKNFRVRLLQTPLQVASTAWISVVLALALGPLGFCLLPIGKSSWSFLWTILALAPQVTAIVLGVMAWRTIEKEPGLSGRGFALSGIIAGSLSVLFVVLLNFYGARWSG